MGSWQDMLAGASDSLFFTNTAKKRIRCEQVDCSDKTDESARATMKKYGVSSFPSIVLVAKDETQVKFDDKITQANLEDFLNSKVI